MQINVGRHTGEFGAENIETMFAEFPQYARRALISAMSSEGYRLKGIVAKTISDGGPDGSWKALNPHTAYLNRAGFRTIKTWRMSRKGVKRGEAARKLSMSLEERSKRFVNTRKSPLLKLKGAVRYRLDKEEMYANIGFIGDDAKGYRLQRIVSHAAKGFRTPLTGRMRRFAFGLGFPLRKETNELVAPARPLMRPIFEKEEGNIVRNLSIRVVNNITRYRHGLEKDWDSMLRDNGGNYR